MIRKIYHSKNFYVQTTFYALLTIVGSAFNYALYPFLVHILPREAFGDMAISLAIANQLASVFLGFNIVSLYVSKNQPESHLTLEVLQKNILKIFSVFCVMFLLLSPLLKKWLQLGSFWPLLALLLVVLLTIPAVMWVGYLQGKGEIVRVGLYGFSSAVFKFVFGIILALIFKSTIAMFGIVLGQLVSVILLAKLPGAKTPSVLSITFIKSHVAEANKLNGYLIGSVFVCSCMSFAQIADFLYAKLFFNPSAAGTYGAISSLSSVAFYGGFLLIWIALPHISKRSTAHNRTIIIKTLGLICLSSLAILAVFTIFENWILRHLIQTIPPEYLNQLSKNVIYQLIVALATLYVYIKLVLKQTKRALVLAASFIVPLLFVPVVYSDGGPQQLVNLVLVAGVVGITMQGLLDFCLHHTDNLTSSNTAKH